MTLIVELATTTCVVQAADTLLTGTTGRWKNDRTVKSTIAHCRDGKVAVAYTGLATVDRLRTDVWLTRELCQFRSWEHGTAEAVDFLVDRLNHATTRNPGLRRYGLTVSLIGLGLDANASHRIVIAKVTNLQRLGAAGEFEDVDPGRHAFARFLIELEAGQWYVGIDGFTNDEHWEVVRRAYRKRLERAMLRVRTKDDAIALTEHAVRIIRMTARNPDLNLRIGHSCTAVTIFEDFTSTSRWFGRDGEVHRLPNLVSQDRCEANRVIVTSPS